MHGPSSGSRKTVEHGSPPPRWGVGHVPVGHWWWLWSQRPAAPTGHYLCWGAFRPFCKKRLGDHLLLPWDTGDLELNSSASSTSTHTFPVSFEDHIPSQMVPCKALAEVRNSTSLSFQQRMLLDLGPFVFQWLLHCGHKKGVLGTSVDPALTWASLITRSPELCWHHKTINSPMFFALCFRVCPTAAVQNFSTCKVFNFRYHDFNVCIFTQLFNFTSCWLCQVYTTEIFSLCT